MSYRHRIDESANQTYQAAHYRNHANNAVFCDKIVFPQIAKNIGLNDADFGLLNLLNLIAEIPDDLSEVSRDMDR